MSTQTTSTLSSTIDNIIDTSIGVGAISKVPPPFASFIRSNKWLGPKNGYYFGTSKQGTGYYVDPLQQKHDLRTNSFDNKLIESNTLESSLRKRPRYGGDGANPNGQSKTARYDDRDNAPTRQYKKTGEELLQEAEEAFLQQQKEDQRFRTISKKIDFTKRSTIQSHVATLKKSIEKNEMMRVKYASIPEKFMESELKLHEDIVSWKDLAASNVSYYTDFVSYGAVECMLGLLTHENTDIALVVMNVFVELLDPNLIKQQLLQEDNEVDGIRCLALAYIDGNGLELSIPTLQRLDPNEEEERKGIEDILTLVEYLLDLDFMGAISSPSTSTTKESIPSILATKTTFISYLLEKMSTRKTKKTKENEIIWNISLKLHASEILATTLQHDDSRIHLKDLSTLPSCSLTEDDTKKTGDVIDGMEALVQCIAQYRKSDPISDEECEYLENVFDALAASLLNDTNVQMFLDRQGIELMLRCINEKVHSGCGSMKVLFFAMSGSSENSSLAYRRASETFVEVGGLKTIFPIFMGRKSSLPKAASCTEAGNLVMIKKYKNIKENENGGDEKKQSISKKIKRCAAANKEWFKSIESSAIKILYSLTRYLDETSPHDAKSRLLAKLVENNCEKCDRLVELTLKYDIKMRQAEYAYYRSDDAEIAEERGIDIDLAALNTKLNKGGDLFHRCSAIIAYAAVGSKRAHEHLLDQLRTQNSSISCVKAALNDFIRVLDENDEQKQQLTLNLASI